MRAIMVCKAVLLALLLAAAGFSARGADPKEPPKKQDAAAAAKDPIEAAFALPKGIVLNEKQQKEFDKLKADKEPVLRDALEREKTAEGEDKTAAVADANQVRSEIKRGLKEILDMPAIEAAQKETADKRAAAKTAKGAKAKKKPKKHP